MKDARKQTLRVFPTKRALDDFACREWAEVGRRAIGRNGRFAAALVVVAGMISLSYVLGQRHRFRALWVE